MNILMIGIGGALGSISRFFLSNFIDNYSNKEFPIGILIINIVGCFCVGLFFGSGAVKEYLNSFFVIGFLGAFTTMSAFSYQSLLIFYNQNFFYSLLYIFITVVLSIIATFIGYTMLNK